MSGSEESGSVSDSPELLKGGDKKFIFLDPGINHLGCSVIELGGTFNVLECHLVNNNRTFTKEEKALELVIGSRAVKVINIIKKTTEIIEQYGIEDVIIEAPFYSALTPVAYGSLLEVIMAIKYTLIIPRGLTLTLIEPTVIKRVFANKGNANKLVMREFLTSRVASGEIGLSYNIDNLSEHEIDSIAVGYTYWKSKQINKVG